MSVLYVSAKDHIEKNHLQLVKTVSTSLNYPTEIVSLKQEWQRQNYDGAWILSSINDFLMPQTLKRFWKKEEEDKRPRGPVMVLPEGKVPENINNILLGYSSYPSAEQAFLRVGMDVALRFQANLHCVKIVKPPKTIWSKKQYPITNTLDCYENILTHESISDGILEYAADSNMDLICLLTRPWDGDNFDLQSSHSYKIILKSNLPVVLYREDDVSKLKWKVGA